MSETQNSNLIAASSSHNLTAILEALEGRNDEKSVKAIECVGNLRKKSEGDSVRACWMVGAIVSAGDLIRIVKNSLNRCLKKGMTHSRKELEELVADINERSDEWFKEGPCKEHINSNKRLFDLVRYMRTELHEANLIDDSEYHYLCAEAEFATDPENGGSPSPRRLEDYDVIREKMAKMKTALEICKEKAKFLANDDNYLEPNFNPCELGMEIRDTAKEALK
jgi:hypothetical protein